MNKIGVFYGSTTGTTEDVAHRIAEKLNVPNGDIHDASKLNDELVKEYDVLVLGTSTWGAGELQDDWYDGIKVLNKADLSQQIVALFGRRRIQTLTVTPSATVSASYTKK